MPSGILFRCLRRSSDERSNISYNTAYTTAGPTLDQEKAFKRLPVRYFSSTKKATESPKNEHAKEVCDMEGMLRLYPWYHGNIDRLSANQMVLCQEESCHGTFLVRRSISRKGQHVITFNSYARATHMRFHFNSTGQCKIKHLWFDTVFDMLEHFQTHEIPLESTKNSDVTLTSYVNNLDKKCKFIACKERYSEQDPIFY